MATGSVQDDEVLFRRVQYGKGHYQLRNETVRVSSSAFGDRAMMPSVDRASLTSGPSSSMQDETDGVLSLLAGDVRELRVPITGTPNDYVLDVVPRPIPQNPAHAQIEPSPDYQAKSRFRKVQEKLARLAKWAIPPYERRRGQT